MSISTVTAQGRVPFLSGTITRGAHYVGEYIFWTQRQELSGISLDEETSFTHIGSQRCTYRTLEAAQARAQEMIQMLAEAGWYVDPEYGFQFYQSRAGRFGFDVFGITMEEHLSRQAAEAAPVEEVEAAPVAEDPAPDSDSIIRSVSAEADELPELDPEEARLAISLETEPTRVTAPRFREWGDANLVSTYYLLPFRFNSAIRMAAHNVAEALVMARDAYSKGAMKSGDLAVKVSDVCRKTVRHQILRKRAQRIESYAGAVWGTIGNTLAKKLLFKAACAAAKVNLTASDNDLYLDTEAMAEASRMFTAYRAAR